MSRYSAYFNVETFEIAALPPSSVKSFNCRSVSRKSPKCNMLYQLAYWTTYKYSENADKLAYFPNKFNFVAKTIVSFFIVQLYIFYYC